MPPLTDKERRALEQLEAERERRIDEKVEKGIAVRVRLPVVVVGAPDGDSDLDERKKARIAELRATGEKREVYFEQKDANGNDVISVIATGVPRPGRDDDYIPPAVSPSMAPAFRYADYTEARALAALDAPKVPPRPAPRREPVERHYVYAEVRPSSEGDPGAIIEGRYAASDGLVRVWDMQGTLLGTETFNGDNPAHVARKVLRAKRGTGFFDPLPYPRDNVV